jgi:hypothetical protein
MSCFCILSIPGDRATATLGIHGFGHSGGKDIFRFRCLFDNAAHYEGPFTGRLGFHIVYYHHNKPYAGGKQYAEYQADPDNTLRHRS